MRTRIGLWLVGLAWIGGHALSQGLEYRPAGIVQSLSRSFKPSLDESRIGAVDDTLFALVEGRLMRFSRAPERLARKSLEIDLPRELQDLASGPGGVVVLPYGKESLWILHRPSQQWWRWDGNSWLGPKPLSAKFFGAAVLADGRLVLNDPHHGTHAFAIVNLDGSVVRRFGRRMPAHLNALEGVANSWLLATDNDKIIAAHAYIPLVRVYGLDGKMLWERRYSTTSDAADREVADALEAEIKVNPETCCIEAKMPRFATAVLSFRREILVRTGLDRSFERWTLEGKQLEPVRLGGLEDPWVASGIIAFGDDLLAYEKNYLRVFRLTRITNPLIGHVRNEKGEPIAQASVTVTVSGWQVFAQRSAKDGAFSFLSVDRSLDGKLLVEAPGYLRTRREGSLAEIGREVVLTKAPTVCVLATDEDGRSIDGFRVRVSKRTTSTRGIQAETGPAVESGGKNRVCASALFPLPWRLKVSALGYASAEHTVSEAGDITMALEKEVPLVLAVTNESGEPVVGAMVVIERPDEPELRDRVLDDDRSLITDAKGTAVAHGLSADSYRLTFEHEDYLRLTEVVDLPLETQPLEVQMKNGASVEVSVVDGTSERPLEGADVQIDPLGHIVPQRLACKTDSSGRCTIHALPIGRFDVHAIAPGHAQGRQNLEVGPEDRVVRKTIAVSSGVRIEGQVHGGEQYPNTRLKIELSIPGAPVASAMVSDRGEFLMENIPPGRASVWVEDAATNGALLYRTFEIPNTGVHVLALELPSPIRVSGGVSDRGRPCASCTVTFSRLGADIGPPEVSAEVTMAARYSARLTSKGRYRVVVQNVQDGREATLLLDVPNDLERDLALDSAQLMVIVADRAGSPVEHATVQAFHATDGALLAQGMTDLDGRVSLALMDALEVNVIAVLGNRTASARVDKAPTMPVRLTLGDPDELELSVVDSGTSLPLPAISARILGSGRDAYFSRLTPGEGGLIDLPRVGTGWQTLVVQATGYAVKTVMIPPAETRARIALIPGGRSFIVSVDPQLGPTCAIELRRSTGEAIALSGNSLPGPVPFFGEHAMFNLIEPGEYVVILHSCSGALVQQPVSLHPGSIPLVSFAP